MKYLKLIVLLLIVSCGSSKGIRGGKKLEGLFVNLEKTDKPKNSEFKITIKETERTERPDEKGVFKVKYPKTGGTLKVLTNEDYLIIEKPIPVNTQKAIVLIDDLREMLTFVEKGQNFDKQYEIALEEFKKTPISLDRHPIFSGCEKEGDKDYEKRCFNKKMRRHIARNFDASLADELGLPEGRKRILTTFYINKQGKVNIDKVKAPHPRLKKEAIRLFKKLPVMKPAMKRNKPVKVSFQIPIIFSVN